MRIFATHSGLIAILVCLGIVYVAGLGSHGMLMWDEAHYAVLGRALSEGRGYVNPAGKPERLRPPVLPSAIAAVLTLNRDAGDTVLRSITVGAALLTITVIYACVYSYGGGLAATAAALAFATFPEVWRATGYLLTEIPFMLFYTPAVFFFFRGLHVDARSFLIAWPCFALALLTRYTAVLFGPTCIALVAVALLSRDREAIARMRTPHFFVGPIVAALLLAPAFARAWFQFGDPLTGFRLAARQLPDYSSHAQMPLLHYLSILPSMLGWFPTLVLGAAIGDIASRRDKLGITSMIAATVIIAWLSQYEWKEPRLISAALPFLAIAIGTGVGRLGADSGNGQPRRSALARRAALAAVAVAFIAGIRLDPSYARTIRLIRHSVTLGFPSFLTAMEAVERGTPATAVVMGPNCYQIAWYSHRRCRPLPSDRTMEADPSRFADHLGGIDYVVVTSFERGQPRYAVDELRRVEHRQPDRVETFSDPRFWTAVVPASAFVQPQSPDEP